jgi:hypothetical protein
MWRRYTQVCDDHDTGWLPGRKPDAQIQALRKNLFPDYLHAFSTILNLQSVGERWHLAPK